MVRRRLLGMRKEKSCVQIAYSNTVLIGTIKTELLGHNNLSQSVVTELTCGCNSPLPSIVG